MNVIPAWREGITGKNTVVTILDDGLETDHPDLERNYVSLLNYLTFSFFIFLLILHTDEKMKARRGRRKKSFFLTNFFFLLTNNSALLC